MLRCAPTRGKHCSGSNVAVGLGGSRFHSMSTTVFENFSAAAAENSAQVYSHPMNRASILVVDDEALVRWSLKERLGRDGHRITEAGTAAEALDRASDVD